MGYDKTRFIFMRLTTKHLEKYGFKYVESNPKLGLLSDWWDMWERGPIHLYDHPFHKGFRVESIRPFRYIYTVKALRRMIIRVNNKK